MYRDEDERDRENDRVSLLKGICQSAWLLSNERNGSHAISQGGAELDNAAQSPSCISDKVTAGLKNTSESHFGNFFSWFIT